MVILIVTKCHFYVGLTLVTVIYQTKTKHEMGIMHTY